MTPERKRFLLGLARQGEAWVAAMRVLGIPERQEAEFYRAHAAFARALRLMEVGEWPPPGDWADDLVGELYPPSSYTMDEFRRDLGQPPKLVCVDGVRR
jgi:hypothetical protein